MGSILPVGRIVRGVIGGVGGGSTPATTPPVTVPVVTPATTPASTNTSTATNGTTPTSTTDDNISERDLGIGGTILTSLRGLLNLNQFAPVRKSLLGE